MPRNPAGDGFHRGEATGPPPLTLWAEFLAEELPQSLGGNGKPESPSLSEWPPGDEQDRE